MGNHAVQYPFLFQWQTFRQKGSGITTIFFNMVGREIEHMFELVFRSTASSRIGAGWMKRWSGGIAVLQQFGGDWTQEKLMRVEMYLKAYVKIVGKHFPKYAYIDAFAGTGYRNQRQREEQGQLICSELLSSDSQQFLDGSARIALRIEPAFTHYVFIEKDAARFAELHRLKQEYPALSDRINFVQDDCNNFIQRICQRNVWGDLRAVLFLDPFGMQVSWNTIEAIAATKAIDLWILFPLGVAVNRVLKKDGQISDSWRRRLDYLFGTNEWYDAFYRTKHNLTLFGEFDEVEKVATLNSIATYFNNRLKSIFARVADNPRPLYNSVNNPLYMLYFAAGNEKGAPTAVKIAQYILQKDSLSSTR